MTGAQPGQNCGLGQRDQIFFGQVALRIDGIYRPRKPIVAGKRPIASLSAIPTDP